MNRWLRSSMFSLAILLALAISAISTVPALADDETPPPPPAETSEAVSPPDEAVPAAAEAPAVIEETAPVEAPAAEEAAPQDGTTADLIASVPDGTDVVVVNDQGENVPLASQEAADLINTNDPIWCPTGVAPNPGVGGCTGTFAGFNLNGTDAGLISVLSGKTVAGTIWILGSYQGDMTLEGGEILLAGLGTTSDYALTIKGGWTGTTAGLIDTANPSEFNVALTILGWNADVTLSDILIQNVSVGSGFAASALTIQTTKKITLTNVKVNSNTGAGVKGAYLENKDLSPSVFGDVSITNSQFNNNNDTGLIVVSEGMITLSGVLVDGNGSGGAWLDNTYAATAKTVTITTGTNEFSDNLLYEGLQIDSKGVITLKDISANNNGADGINLDNTQGTAVGVTLSGTTIASENAGTGIWIISNGTITTSTLIANSNSVRGAYLANNTAGTALGVTVSGSSNQFKFNGSSDGLYVYSNGAITLNSITANNNGADGAYLNNDAFPSGSAPVTLTGTNIFKDNFFTGLDILSDGIVTVSNVTADYNGIDGANGYGVLVNNNGATTPKAVTFSGINEFNGNYYDGVKVLSDGAITLSNVTANGNGLRGVNLQNADNPAIPQNVTISGYTTANGNTGGSGISILTYGTVSLNKVTANANSANGMIINNSSGSLSRAVTISGVNTFNNNTNGDGLNITSLGAVTLNSVTAVGNANGFGIFVVNFNGPAASGITLTGLSDVEGNGRDGISFTSKGNIVIKDVMATDNGQLQSAAHADGHGVYLTNNGLGGTGSVSIGTSTANWFNDLSGNFLSGLEIRSNGAVTISNVTAEGNGLDNTVDSVYGYGTYVDNSFAPTTPMSVTLLGMNAFNGNAYAGLYINSKGAVTLNKITADGNGTLTIASFGAVIMNTAGGTAQNITLNGYGEFFGNTSGGLSIGSYGMVTLTTLDAEYNTGDGVNINNAGSFAKTVTINGTNNFSNNPNNGLYIVSDGTVTLNSVTSSYNTNGYGVYVDNHLSGSPTSGINLTGKSYINDNGNDGVYFFSRGNIVLKDLNADDNGQLGSPSFGYGVYVDNTGGTGSVTLGTSTANWVNDLSGNYLSGLWIQTRGAITLSNVAADGNGTISLNGYGAHLSNTGASTPLAVTLLGINEFNDNYNTGLFINTKGAVTLNKTTADNNNGDANASGAFITNNTNHLVPQNVTISGYGEFAANELYGLYVQTYGTVALTYIYAETNGSDGVFVDNYQAAGPDGAGTLARAVTVSGYLKSFGNGGHGVWIVSRGAVTIANLDASGGNVMGGAKLDNSGAGSGGVMLTGANFAPTNAAAFGLWVVSNGAITINNLEANDNGAWGARLDNSTAATPLAVTLTTTTTGTSEFSDNTLTGLVILTKGAVVLSKLTANNNANNGVYVLNSYAGTQAPQNVTLTGYGVFKNNGDDGLGVFSYGAITLNNLTANDNGQNADTVTPTGWGVVLDNCNFVSGCIAVTAKSVTVNGINTFNGNFQDGLDIRSLGSITASNLTANDNGSDGVDLYNAYSAGFYGITLTGTNVFQSNLQGGLVVGTNGIVSLNNVSGNFNGTRGVFIDSSNLVKQAKINITGTNYFNGNGSDGLFVISDAAITLNNITANGNGAHGALLDNAAAYYPLLWAGSAIKLTGINTFSGNDVSGLFFNANGNVEISHITADNNDPINSYGGSGVDGSSSTGSVLITCGSMTNNGAYGWKLGALTTITLKGVFAYGNGNPANTNVVSGTPVITRTCP